MTAFSELEESRQKLIRHRITRAVAEKVQREDVVALYAVAYQEATVNREHNLTLEGDALKQSWKVGNDMLQMLLQRIQQKRDFDLSNIILEVLQEEGVVDPNGVDLTNTTMFLINGALA